MTSQWHPDATALAEYRAGLTGGRRARRLAAHVASCASCASVNDQLAAVTTVLASAPDLAMPDAVESRIMAALATEAALVSEASIATEAPHDTQAAHGTPAKRDTALRPVGGDGGGSRRRPDGGRSGPGNRWLRPSVLVSAAAAGLVLIGGAYGIAHLTSAPASSTAASSAAGSAAGSAAAGSDSSPFAGAAAPPGTHTRLEPASSGSAAAFAVTVSGTSYQPATLAEQVRAEVARAAGTAAPATAKAAPSAQLAGCVLHLTGQVRPSLVDRATYQGKPAYVIAVANWAWVVGPGCTAGNPQLIASAGL
jgi:hypothetical protein